MFDQWLSLKVVLLVVAAFAILGWACFRLAHRGINPGDLGAVDMNDERRKNLIESDRDRWK